MLLAASGILHLLKRVRIAGMIEWIAIAWIVTAGSTPVPQAMVSSLESAYRPFQLTLDTSSYPQHILILGGGHTVSPELPASIQLSDAALVRLAEGLRIKHLLGRGKLICSGSSATRRTTQAEILAQTAIDLGVSAADTLQMRWPKRTEEELIAFKERFGNSPVIVVTSARHFPRVRMICRRVGLKVEPAPTDFLLKRDPLVSRYEFYPSVNKLAMMESALHEYLGMTELYIRGLFN